MVRRIFITAPEAYHPRIREAFKRVAPHEIMPIFSPLITTVSQANNAETQKFRLEHESYDFIICSSRMAVMVLAEIGIKLSHSDRRIIAIGKDQDAVRSVLNVEPALQDAEPSMMGIVNALKRIDGLSNKKIAVLLPSFIGLPIPSTISNFL
ncbi:MAG: hypothetical protein K6E54_00795, partial [Bacteroidaceae bacterium]|nr:hypothetical protein [Bacteroidaceae bacterium]